jgi:hypothetical protein
VQNVAMYSNNQPWNVLFNPVWQESDRYNWLAMELKMKNHHISNIKHHSLDWVFCAADINTQNVTAVILGYAGIM